MKNIFILFVCVCSFAIKAQDSSYCYNAGISITRNEIIAETIAIKPTPENSLILMPYVMNEKEVLFILTEKTNSEINRLLKKMNRANNLKQIGFVAIPTGLIGAISFAGTKNLSDDKNIFRGAQQEIGVGLLALSTICLSTSYYFKTQCAKNYKKAIAKYNQLYN